MSYAFFTLAAAFIGASIAFFAASPKFLEQRIERKEQEMVSNFTNTCITLTQQNRNQAGKKDAISDLLLKYEDILKYPNYRVNLMMGFLGLGIIFIICEFVEEISVASNLSSYVVPIILFIFCTIIFIIWVLPSITGLRRISR